VFGLKARAPEGKAASLQILAEAGDDLVDQHPLLAIVRRFDRSQHPQINAHVVAGADQRLHILGKARPAVAGASVEKLRADAPVAADAVAHQRSTA